MTRRRRLRESKLSDADSYEAALKRQIVDVIDMWAECSRPVCYRARVCRGAGTPCFEEERPIVRNSVIGVVGDWCRLLNIAFEHDDEDYVDW